MSGRDERYQPRHGPLRTLLDKLGVKPGSKDLKRLAALERLIKRDGAIWVVTPKRTGLRGALRARGPLPPGLKDVDVIAAAKAAGLVDNKVVAFSETRTALRLVVPLSRR